MLEKDDSVRLAFGTMGFRLLRQDRKVGKKTFDKRDSNWEIDSVVAFVPLKKKQIIITSSIKK